MPYRLLARAALVLATLLLLPLLVGAENGLPAQVGMLLLAALALSSIPLASAALIGTYSLLVSEYRPGEWIEVQVFGRAIAGEVTFVDFLHVRVVPPDGGEVRLPHLALLMAPVSRLARAQALEVEFAVPIGSLPPGRALEVVRATTQRVRTAAHLVDEASVVLRSVDDTHTHFALVIPGGTPALRTALLVALHEATHAGIAP